MKTVKKDLEYWAIPCQFQNISESGQNIQSNFSEILLIYSLPHMMKIGKF